MWFQHSEIEKVIVPNSVKTLGEGAFVGCERLCEVAFEPNSHLESIGDHCFSRCGLREVTVPRNVLAIGSHAFNNCLELSQFSFEPGSQIESVGKHVFANTRLHPAKVQYPDTFKFVGSEWGGAF